MSQPAGAFEALSARAAESSTLESEPAHSAGCVFRDIACSEYAAWDAFVAASPQSSVFCRTWWLRAVCQHVRIRGLFKNSSLIAGIPLYSERRYGVPLCTMPRLTQTMGVVMEPLCGKRSSVASRQTEILTAFANEIAKQSTFFQAFHPSLQNWLPFYWAGFKQTTRVTYVIEDTRDSKEIWGNISHRVRAEIRKAENQGLEVQPCSIETLLELESKTFSRQNLELPHSPDVLRRIHIAAKENNAGQCFAVVDQQGRVHCAGFIVWDSSRAYYLVSGGDPAVRTSGATSLLVWHLIRYAGERSKIFDFEGSMLQQVERLFRNFGAIAVPYNFIVKCPWWLHTFLLFRNKL
jgi:hypothetical protein